MLWKGLYNRVSSSLILKLLIPLVTVAVIIGLVFGVVTIKFNSSYLANVTQSMQKQTLTAQVSSVSILMKGYYHVFFSLAVDTQLRKLIKESEEGEPMELVNRKAAELIKQYMIMDSDVISVNLVSVNGEIFGYNRSINLTSRIWNQESRDMLDNIISECSQNKNVLFFADDRLVDPYGDNMFHIAIQLWDFYSSSPDGYLIMTVRTRSLARALVTKDQVSTETAHSAIILDNGDFIVHSEDELIGRNIFDQHKDKYTDVRYADTGSYNVQVVNIYDRRENMYTVIFYNVVMMLIVLFILVVYLAVTINILKKAYKSVKLLLRGIREVERGRLDVEININGNDELSLISRALNKMAASLKDIRENSEKENSEKLRALDMQRKAEIRAMESQINTHFLANTINMISCTSIEQGNHQVAKLLKALSSCMRYTFEKSVRPLTVRDELRQLDHYLMLQKERCGKKFDYVIRADESVLDDYIHKLMIQPFVENSILHGFTNMTSGGLLEINVRRFRSDKLAISVYDNGHGMPRQQVEAIHAMFSGKWHPDNMGIGIENVVYRIRRYYKDAWLHIRSSGYIGTKINIILPQLEDESPTIWQ